MEVYACELNNHVKKYGLPDIIGISALFSPQYNSMIEIANYCRQVFPESFITGGGGIPTNQYKKIFKCCDAFDALCYGEGEVPLCDLVSSDSYMEFATKSASWVTRGTLNKALVNNLIYDLDEIPAPDYSILNISDYQINLNALHHAISDKGEHDVLIPFMTSRGCPHECCFCASHSVHGRALRYHSLNFVEKTIKYLKNTLNCSWLVIQDDNFAFNKERAYNIINIIKKNNLKASFPNGIAMYTLDLDFLNALKSCNINQITVPIESGSERVLNNVMHKPLNKKIIRRVTQNCLKVDVRLNANIMIGLPGETLSDIRDSINFLKTLPVHWYYIYSATPLPGSEIFDICIDNGYIDENKLFLSGYKNPIISTSNFSSAQIFELTYYMNLELNFLHNYCVRCKNYALAKIEFAKVVDVRNDHALAYFMLSVCEAALEQADNSFELLKKCIYLLHSNEKWKETFAHFKNEVISLAEVHFRSDAFNFFDKQTNDIW